MKEFSLKKSIDLLADKDFSSFISQLAKLESTLCDLPLATQRLMHSQFMKSHYTNHEPMHHVMDQKISGNDAYEIPIRIYIPNESKHLPVMMYFHGGGWVFGSIEDADAVCRRLARYLDCIVVSVAYRLAPEFPFPKPLEDCFSATQWVTENAHLFGGDHNKVLVCGESAGGNLAGAVALMARHTQSFSLTAQVLIYPVICSVIKDEVYDLCPDHYFLTKEDMKFFWDCYTPTHDAAKHPYASLDLNKELSHLPPTLIITAEYDPLNYDIDKYAVALQQAGVCVLTRSFPGLIHGFLYIPLYRDAQKVEWTKQLRGMLEELRL